MKKQTMHADEETKKERERTFSTNTKFNKYEKEWLMKREKS